LEVVRENSRIKLMLEGNALENVKSYKLHGVYVTETFDNAE